MKVNESSTAPPYMVRVGVGCMKQYKSCIWDEFPHPLPNIADLSHLCYCSTQRQAPKIIQVSVLEVR